MRILYAAGPGDVIGAHKSWASGQPHPSQVSLTYSGQFADYCRDVEAKAYIISSHADRRRVTDGNFTLEHRPKPMSGAGGLKYHLSQVLYGVGIVASALRYRAHAVVAHSDTTHLFVLAPLRLFGVRVVPSLHNTLWPAGFPPHGLVSRTLLKLNGLFFRWFASAVVCVSPECVRQVRSISGGRPQGIYDMRAQFYPLYFSSIRKAPEHASRPFRIAFVGRADHDKGAFDVLKMAQKVNSERPGETHWELCGDGPDLAELRKSTADLGLDSIITIRGWTSPEEMKDVLSRSHIAIVPTRSSFPEGLAKTAAEAILAGRPLITSAVTPALEVLRPACLEAKADDVDSYVSCVMRLLDDQETFERLRDACKDLQSQFYDRGRGHCSALKAAISGA
jgi:glycogen(starch) synthase